MSNEITNIGLSAGMLGVVAGTATYAAGSSLYSKTSATRKFGPEKVKEFDDLKARYLEARKKVFSTFDTMVDNAEKGTNTLAQDGDAFGTAMNDPIRKRTLEHPVALFYKKGTAVKKIGFKIALVGIAVLLVAAPIKYFFGSTQQ